MSSWMCENYDFISSMAAKCCSGGSSYCPPPPPPQPTPDPVDTMCKIDADFKDTATLLTIRAGDQDIILTCGGEYGITMMGPAGVLTVWRQATGSSGLTWSTASCADMTKNLTAYFNNEYMHNRYHKVTVKEFVKTYGAACCGSLEKARDACEVFLSAPARANSNNIVTLCLVGSTCC